MHPRSSLWSRLNWLRAAVLGANDGHVSTAALVVGVAGATDSRSVLLTVGLAGLLSGALSMAVGEYVSVSIQRDSQRAALANERREIDETPDEELDELTRMYEAKGLTPEVAREVAEQLTRRDALAAHAETELGIDPKALTNPWHAALASFPSFTLGALLPVIAIVLPPPEMRLYVTVALVLVTLAAFGWTAARLGGARPRRAVIRNVCGGTLAMAVTYGIGSWLGAATGF
ncbi:VIT family protein [Streptomyces sp. ACA25]|nr:VIT family protein [Streptomyces sp. ACA25]MDB1089938.1 VIT family protein [Streptomyces sp. ACA25]